MYVAEGQEDQRSIFRNDAGSKEYVDFVQGVGWSVDLGTHTGFLGGLDANGGTTGKTAPYYANSTYEVIFHTVTRMPTVDTDPQQIQKVDSPTRLFDTRRNVTLVMTLSTLFGVNTSEITIHRRLRLSSMTHVSNMPQPRNFLNVHRCCCLSFVQWVV